MPANRAAQFARIKVTHFPSADENNQCLHLETQASRDFTGSSGVFSVTCPVRPFVRLEQIRTNFVPKNGINFPLTIFGKAE